MPRIIADPGIIDETEEIAKKVFGKNGILPLPPDSTEIISGQNGYGRISIYLHKKRNRTAKILNAIWEAFKKNSKNYIVEIHDQPKKLWRKF